MKSAAAPAPLQYAPERAASIAARAPRVDLALRRGHVDAQPSKVEVRGELSGESTRGGEAMQRR
jgi:hypothetical protein